MSAAWFFALRHYRWQNAMVLAVGLLVLAIIIAALGTTMRPWGEWHPLTRGLYVMMVAAVPLPLVLLYLHRYLCYRAARLIARQHPQKLDYAGGYHALDLHDDGGRLSYLFRRRQGAGYLMVTMTASWSVAALSDDEAQEWLVGLRIPSNDAE